MRFWMSGEHKMGDYNRLALLILIMIVVCLIVGATTIGLLYEQAFDRERDRLVNIAQSQARLMEALAHLEPVASRAEGQPAADVISTIWKAIASFANTLLAKPPKFRSRDEAAIASSI